MTIVDPVRAPVLPDGLVVVVKQECETCRMIEPVLAALARGDQPLTVFTQDDEDFPRGVAHQSDAELAVCGTTVNHVLMLIVITDGGEVERTVGWQREPVAAPHR